MNIEELKLELKKSIQELSCYNFETFTAIELYYTIATKLNEVIKELSRHENLVSEEIIKQNNALQEMLDSGLHNEVVNKINDMVNDGTMDLIINQNVLEDLNSQIKDIENKKLNYFITPEMFGAKGDGVTDDSNAIQSAVNSGKTVILGSNKTYKIIDTILLPNNANIVGDNTTIISNAAIAFYHTAGVGNPITSISLKNITNIKRSIHLIKTAHSDNIEACS